MQSILNTNNFEAFRTDDGILVQEKKGGALKIGIIIACVGAVMFAISFINVSSQTGTIIHTIFTYVFGWGGITLMVLGVLLAIFKGIVIKPGKVVFDTKKAELQLRGQTIPLSEISEITMMNNPVMGRNLAGILFMHNGKKKGMLSGTLTNSQVPEMETFVAELNSLVKK